MPCTFPQTESMTKGQCNFEHFCNPDPLEHNASIIFGISVVVQRLIMIQYAG